MKNTYVNPIMDIRRFELENIVTASGADGAKIAEDALNNAGVMKVKALNVQTELDISEY